MIGKLKSFFVLVSFCLVVFKLSILIRKVFINLRFVINFYLVDYENIYNLMNDLE